MKKDLLVLVGPTGSGKTALAERIAEGRACSLLSADSQQVYRGMDIGTAKPQGAAKQRWKLLDLVDPGQRFSAGEYCRRAAPLCQEAWASGRLPVLAGGTGLYLKALLEGLAEIPLVPEALRQALSEEFQRGGLEPLLARLDQADPVIAAQLDRKNPRRVLRALEVFEATGRPLSAWQALPAPAPLQPERTLWLGLDPGVESLDERIETRADACLAQGWLNEVKTLVERLGADVIRQSPAIGYAELAACLDGGLSQAQARAAIFQRTRHYARRQRTWFKALPQIQWHETLPSAQAALDAF